MEWVNVKDELPSGAGDIVKVRRENGDELKAYYSKDKMAWLLRYYKGPTSHFQNHATREFLFDITHWLRH